MTCPMCGKPTLQALKPFCSRRCADLDLARWLNGSYAIPSNDPDDMEHLEAALSEASRKEDPDRQH